MGQSCDGLASYPVGSSNIPSHFIVYKPGHPAMDWHPIQGEVAIFLVASCYRNWVKLWLCGLPVACGTVVACVANIRERREGKDICN